MKNSKTLTALVKVEAKNLKKFATKKELNKLNIETFDAKQGGSCIYGQMTGSCYSHRASSLIRKCATRIFLTDYNETENILSRKLDGSPKRKSRSYFWSPIEVFVYGRGDRTNKKIISYLKNETKTLSI